MVGSDMEATHRPPENKAGVPVNGVVTVAFVTGEQGGMFIAERFSVMGNKKTNIYAHKHAAIHLSSWVIHSSILRGLLSPEKNTQYTDTPD